MKTYVYTVLSSDGSNLYIGITQNLDQRLSSHSNEKNWWNEVHTITLRTFSTREEAEAEERYQIAVKCPKYNQMSGVKIRPERRLIDRVAPKTRAKLPEDEIEYLQTLGSEATYQRCSELQAAGWSVLSMLEGAKVTPTAPQLRLELKYRTPTPSGRPVPLPPKTRSEQHMEYRNKHEQDNYLSDEEKEALIYLAKGAKKFRPQYGPTHPVTQLAEEYKQLITMLHDRGVLFSTIALVVGCNESNIRRKYIRP